MKTQLIKQTKSISCTGLKSKKIEHLYTFDKNNLKFIKHDLFVKEIDEGAELAKRLNPLEKMVTKYMKPGGNEIDLIAIFEKQHNGELNVVNTISGSKTF